MGTRWLQRTFGASAVDKELTLEVDGVFLELFEPFPFKHLPDVILGQLRAIGDHMALLRIKIEGEAGVLGHVLVLQW